MSKLTALLSVFVLFASSGLVPVFGAAVPSPASLQTPTATQAVAGAWDTVWRGNGGLRDLSCATAAKCHAVGDGGLYLRTSDGGATWHYEQVGEGVNLNALAFADSVHGLIVGGNGAVFRTADGGATWQASVTPTAAGLGDVSLLATGQAWAVTADSAVVFSSTDWGKTWTSHPSARPAGFHAISMLTPTTGMAVGLSGLVAGTTDGGTTWTDVATPFPGWADLYALSFADAQHGWAAGQAGNMIRTTDGGNHWQAVDSKLTADILALHFAGDFGVLGAVGGIVATAPDGVTWTPRLPAQAGARDATAVYASGSTDVWAAGLIKASPDTGARAWWIQHSTDGVAFSRSAGDLGLKPDLLDVAYVTPDIGYVVGEDRSIGKTTDGGDTWSWRVLDPGNDKYVYQEVACANTEQCWIGGWSGFVYATTDGGTTWIKQIVPNVTAPIYAITMWDSSLGWLGTNTGINNGAMFYTTNGGKNWLASAADGDNVSVAISMVSPTQGWSALRQYSYRLTTNGGRYWRRVINPNLSAGFFEAIKALDANQDGQVDNVWLVGCMGKECTDPRTGAIARTTDAGGSWKYQPLPANTPPLKAVVMFDGLTGWTGGEQGVLLYTESGGSTWERVESSLPAASAAHITDLGFVGRERGLATSYGGYIIRFTGPGATLGSFSQAGAIVVDGQAGDWYEGGALRLDSAAAATVLGPEPPPEPADISVELRSRWTADDLHFLAEITDDQVTDADSIQFAIDGLDDGRWNGSDDHLVTIRSDGSLADEMHPEQAGDFVVQTSLTATGWLAELAVPASLLGRTDLAEGATAGLNVALNDDDGDGAAHMLVLEGRRIDANPAIFATVRLVGDTLSFQQGVEGYGGASDTYLERWTDQSGNTARGEEPVLQVITNFGNVYADMLLRFEQPFLPAGAQITQAALDLAVMNRRFDEPLVITAYRMLKPWQEATATWNQAAPGQAWGAKGALQAGTDYDPIPLGTVTLLPGSTAAQVQWDVTAGVAAWASQPDANYGVLLRPSSGSRYLYTASSEHGDTAKRPRLTVKFALQPQPVTPTPTATPTPEATATPTATPSPTGTATPTPTPPVARVHGVIFDDANGNGGLDDGEAPLAGAQVGITGPGVNSSLITAADGIYAFAGLAPGSYVVTEASPAGYGPSSPVTPLNVMLGSGDDLQLDFAHRALPSPTPSPTLIPTAPQLYLPLLTRS